MSTQGGSRRAAKPYRRPQPDAARRAAFDVLRAVAERDAYANLVLPELLTSRGIEGRDAAFATELTYGTLRGQGTYDVVLAACVDRPLDQVDPPVRDVAPARRPPAARDAGALARRGVRDGRAGPRRARRRSRQVRERRAAPGRRPRPGVVGRRARPGVRRGPGRAPRGRALAPALGGLRRPGRAATARSTRRRRCSPPTTWRPRSAWLPGRVAPRSPSWSPPGRCRAGGRPYAATLPGGEPGRDPGGAGGPRGRAGRGQPAGRAGAGRGAGRGA